MFTVRFEKDGKIQYGKLENNSIEAFAGEPFGTPMLTGERYALEEVQLLAPCRPSKVICLGLNYRDHAEEFQFEIPKWPILFMKPQTAVTGHGAEIIYPNDMSRRLDYEAELAVVIGKTAKDVAKEQAMDYVFGYTCGNDVTARDLQPKNGQWTIAKSFDTFMPLGPVIATDVNPQDLKIEAVLNGEVKQSSNTGNLIFDVPYLVHYISNIMTLHPGDVIMTGTSSGVGPMQAGDSITVRIEGIGELVNTVALKYPNGGKAPKTCEK